LLFIYKSHTENVGKPHFAHHWYKPNCLTAITSHCLATLPAKKFAFNTYTRQNAYHRNLKYIFEYLLSCYCYATKANSTVEQFVRKFRNLFLQAEKRI